MLSFKQFFLPVFLFLFYSASVSAQCPPGQNLIRVQISPDYYFYEEHWTITVVNTGEVLFRDSVPDESYHEYTYCVPEGNCLKFTLKDDAGDGMTPNGFCKVYFNNDLVMSVDGNEYYSTKSVIFGCPPGSTCVDAIPITLGSWATPDASQAWYSFVPDSSGIYEVNTCDSLNPCGSKIWVYHTCENILQTENYVGSDFFAENGCDHGALATLYLAAHTEYLIRLRYQPSGCSDQPLHFNLQYNGPIKGCMDPNSCNFNPLATIPDTCYYPGDPNCKFKPDLAVNDSVFLNSLEIASIDNSNPCLLQEGCVRGIGIRNVIKFSTQIDNIGDADYYIGATPANIHEPSTQYIWDPCHGHWHYVGYAEYVLYNSSGQRLAIGTKTGFCVFDLACPWGAKKFSCKTMGISYGCMDAYGKDTDCQWVDITNIPPDTYTLVVRVNWDKSPDSLGNVEKTFDNNWAQTCFSLNYPNGIPEVEFFSNNCAPYTDCLGETFGDAEPDCNGVCNGPSLHGDINQDTTRNESDIQQYLSVANSGNGDPSNCLDLNADGALSVYDAALLQECTLHQNDPGYWIQRFPCRFPGGLVNPQQPVRYSIGSLDTIAKTLDINIVNPHSKLLAYQFRVSGLKIDSVRNLSAGFNPDLRFNSASGNIMALGLDESYVNKNALPAPFLRIYYSGLPSPNICLDTIAETVNLEYQLCDSGIDNPQCIASGTSAVKETNSGTIRYYIQPNPFGDQATVFFENEESEPVDILLEDITGKTVRHFEGIRDSFVTFERAGLPSGTYIFTLRSAKGIVSGKIMAR